MPCRFGCKVANKVNRLPIQFAVVCIVMLDELPCHVFLAAYPDENILTNNRLMGEHPEETC